MTGRGYLVTAQPAKHFTTTFIYSETNLFLIVMPEYAQRRKYPNLYDAQGNCIFKCQGEFITPEEEFQSALPESVPNLRIKRTKVCCMACVKFRTCPVSCDVIKNLVKLGFGK